MIKFKISLQDNEGEFAIYRHGANEREVEQKVKEEIATLDWSIVSIEKVST